MKFQLKHKLCLGISLLTAILVYGCETQTRINDILDEGINDFHYFLRDSYHGENEIMEGVKNYIPNPRAHKNIIMLNIDNETLDDIKERGSGWPFPWSVYAATTRFLASGKPQVLYYGVPLMDDNPEEIMLAESFVGAGNVVVSYHLDLDKSSFEKNENINMDIVNTYRWPGVKDPDGFDDSNVTIVPSNKYLMKAAAATGYDEIFMIDEKRSDTKVKKIPLVILHKNHYYPGTVLAMVMQYYSITDRDVEIRPGQYIKLKNIPNSMLTVPHEKDEIYIPVDSDGYMRINYAGSAGSFQGYSYSLFYSEEGDMAGNDSLEEKLLIVGVNRTRRIPVTILPTPSGSMIANEIRAHAINTIIKQDFVREMGGTAKAVIFFLTAILLGLAIPRMHWLLSTILSLIVMESGLILVSFFAFEAYSFMLPVAMFGQLFSINLIISLPVVLLLKDKEYIRKDKPFDGTRPANI